MPTSTKKFNPEIDAELYKEFAAFVERNGQADRDVLLKALKSYTIKHQVARTEVNAVDPSTANIRDLLKPLAKTGRKPD
jgi:hypothetical protein